MNERKLKRGAYSKKLMGHKLWICNYSHISILNFEINCENSVKCSQKKKTFYGIGPKVKGMLYKLLGKYEQEMLALIAIMYAIQNWAKWSKLGCS